LLVYDLSPDEALEMSAKFAEYALFLKQLARRQKGTEETLKASGKHFAETAAKALMEISRDEGMVPFLERVRTTLLERAKYADTALESAKTLASFGALPDGSFEESRKVFEPLARWRRACATALGRLLSIYGQGPVDAPPDGPKLRLLEPAQPGA
jgi:hypothetical protein